MPIERTPNNLYAGHAVVFDAMPYVRYAEQVQARKQAKDNAIDQYFQKLPSTINPAGMRNVDVPDFVSKTNDLRDFYNQNKDKIKNPRIDNGKAQTEYFSRVEDGKLYVQRSKQTEEMKKPLVAILADPNKRGRIRDNTFEAIAKHDLPLNDKEHKPIDFNSDIFKPKSFEADKYFKSFSDIKMTEDITTSNDPKNPLKDVVTTKFYFDPKSISAISQRARDRYKNDDGFAEYVETELSKPEEYAALNDQFKKHMGRNIDISHPEELAIAFTLTGKQLEYEKEKFATDQNAVMNKRLADAKAMEDIRQANREKLRGTSNKQREDITSIDIYSSIKEKTELKRNNPIRSWNGGRPGGALIPKAVPVNSLEEYEQEFILKKARAAGGNDITVAGIYIRQYDDGDVAIVKVEDDKPLTKLSRMGSNVAANQPLGMKSKQKAANDAKGNKAVMSKEALDAYLKKKGLIK